MPLNCVARSPRELRWTADASALMPACNLRFHPLMNNFLATLGVGPTLIARGDGPYVYNERGDRFINGFSGLWNVALGHGRKELIEAATSQMEELAFASCFRQVHPVAIELAAKLVEVSGGRYEHVYLGTNGSEAVETALKMTRQYFRQSRSARDRGRSKFISLRGSYHGVSFGALSTSGLESDTEKFGPLAPGFSQIDPPYCYRCPYGKNGYPECGLPWADALDKAILSEGAEEVAAFILEPVMGAHGVISPPDEYFKRVAQTCRRHGLLFIVDEVTTGFGRTGELFASQNWNPPPDIMCLGKAISSGYLPLSATLATDDIYRRFDGNGNQFEHGSTASGHPVCAAVGLATIDIIQSERLPENASKVGDYLIAGIRSTLGDQAHVGDIRGRGLMIGIELAADKLGKAPLSDRKAFGYVLQASSLGLLMYCRGSFLGLFPPLTIDRTIADDVIRILGKVFHGNLTEKTARNLRLAKELAHVKLGKSNPS